MLVLIKGAGDLATGVAVRLLNSGFQVVMTDLEKPTAVRRAAAFSQAVYDAQTTVEGYTARHCDSAAQARALLALGEVPYDRWVRFVWKLILIFFLLTLAFLAVSAIL